jgi:mannitol operon transcriptional antiterminator
VSAASDIAPLAGIPLRQRLILDHLLTAKDDVTAGELAQLIGTSVRTVRRDLPEIENFLRPYRLTLQKKAGAGLRLNGSATNREALRHELPSSSIASVRPSDRQAWLACTLLAAIEPVKLHTLASELHITITTASHDLDTLEPWLASYRLTLQRRRGWGVALEGTETDRRNAIIDLFFSQFDEPARLALFDMQASPAPTSGDTFLRPAWLLISAIHFRTTARLLHDLELNHPLALEPAARLEFALHVALTLERVGTGRICEPAVAAAGTPVLDALADRLGATLRSPLPDTERARLSLLLQGAAEPATSPEPALLPLLQRFLLACDARFGVPLSADPALLDGLLPHLTRTLQRLRNHLPIRNPLLQEIRENYRDLFSLIRAAADQVFTDPTLPDTEIGFLVLHVGSALERRRHRRWRALVVCSAGVGTSRMLASRLRTELPEIDIANLLAWQDAATIDPASYDLVLSTIPLDWPRERYLVVSPLLQEKDVREINAHLERLASQQRISQPLLPGPDPAATRLSQAQRQEACIDALLHGWRIHTLAAHDGPLVALIPAICQPLLANGTLLDASIAATQLVTRVGQSSLVIPDSRLAFLHARDAGIARPSITLHRLAQPLIVHGTAVDQCLLMLAPLKLHRTEVAVLSRISSLLMEAATIEALTRGDETATRDHLARELHQLQCE